jgi:tetratricopeptide (TPR) repeat protein
LTTKLPEKPRSHEVDDLTVAAFLYQKPAGWVVNEHRKDYGRDLHVTVPAKPGYVGGDDFWVQLKGSDSPQFLADGIHLTRDLKTSTLNHLRSLSSPVMFAVCDVSKEDRPIYWVWIEEALKELEQRNSRWATQDSVSIRVPIKNVLATGASLIEEQVKVWHFDRHVNQTMAGFIRPAMALPPTSEGNEYTDTTAYVQQRVVPGLRDAGLVEVEESGEATPLTPQQRTFREKLRELGAQLDKYRDADAKEIIGQIEPDASATTPRLRAAYHNSRGVLAIHDDAHERALDEFSTASSLDPNNALIAANLLMIEYTLSQENPSGRPLPSSWEERLSNLLKNTPGLLPAIKLRMRRLAETDGVSAVKEFVREHALAEGQRREVLTLLAEIQLFAGHAGEALALLSEAEPPNEGQETWFYSLKGLALFRLAAPSVRQIGDGRVLLQGMGPADLDLPLLEQSCTATEEALSHAAEQAPSHVFEEIAANAAIARLLRGESEKAIKLSLSFLGRFPESSLLNGVLATTYFMNRQPEKAAPYARQAFTLDDATGETYRNLVLILMAAERFDDVLNEIDKRERRGFRDTEEEHLSLQIAAIAYAENGSFEDANRCIRKLFEDPAAAVNATLAEVEVLRREGKGPEELKSLLRKQLASYPKNPWLLTSLIREIGWPDNDDDAREMVYAVEGIAESRQLTSVEFAALGYAYVQVGKTEEAERIFRSAANRYPEDSRLQFEYAQALALNGNEEGAYSELRQYLNLAKGDPVVYRNLASLAFSTGRIEEAIKWLGRAVTRATDPKDRGELNHLLWELCRRRGDPARELLRYVIGFGQTTSDDTDAEARFLMMAFLTPLQPQDLTDPEIAASREDISRRLDAFIEAHPQHQGLRALKIPLDLSDEEQAQRLMQELAYISLPRRLAADKMELAARAAPWPLCLRAPLLHNSNSLFSYWEACVQSRNYTDAVHIFYSPLDVDREANGVPLGQRVVVDLTALFTLCALGLLEEAPKVFQQLILARKTREAIWGELGRVGYRSSLAQKLNDWIARHGAVIRVRTATPQATDEVQRVLDDLLAYGVGESFVLAEQLNQVLFSDEGVVRVEARKKGSPLAFSTIGLLRRLRKAGRLRLEDETKLLATLMRLNYRYVPFGPEHLHAALMSLGPEITPDSLRSDETMRSLLDQFGETHVTLESLLKILVEWWPKLLNTEEISDLLIERIVNWVTFVATQRLMVAGRIPSNRDLDNIPSEILAALLTAVRGLPVFGRAWSIIKHCAENTARNSESRYEKILFEQIPDVIVNSFRQSGIGLGGIQHATFNLVSALPEEDRAKWEERLVTIHRLTPIS